MSLLNPGDSIGGSFSEYVEGRYGKTLINAKAEIVVTSDETTEEAQARLGAVLVHTLDNLTTAHSNNKKGA